MKAKEFFRPIRDVATAALPPPLEHNVVIPDGHALLYGFGGHGKGVIAAWVAAQYTKVGINVGVLDYEDNADEWLSRVDRFGGNLSRLFIATPRPDGVLSGAIWEQAEEIKGFAADLRIGFLIIDSVLPAAEVDGERMGDPNPPQDYIRALKYIAIASLSLGHVSGAITRHSLSKPWGSHYWRNAFRINWAVWQAEESQTVDVFTTKRNRYKHRTYRIDWAWADVLLDGETPPDLNWSEKGTGADPVLLGYLAGIPRRAEDPDGMSAGDMDAMWDVKNGWRRREDLIAATLLTRSDSLVKVAGSRAKGEWRYWRSDIALKSATGALITTGAQGAVETSDMPTDRPPESGADGSQSGGSPTGAQLRKRIGVRSGPVGAGVLVASRSKA